MPRYLRLLVVGLVSVALALGFTTTGATAAPKPAPVLAPQAATPTSCANAQAIDKQAEIKTQKLKNKFKAKKKKFKKAAKAFKKAKTVKNKKAKQKAAKKKKRAKKAYRRALKQRIATLDLVSVSCTSTTPTTPGTPGNPGNPGGPGTPGNPGTPGTSPLAPVCAAIPQLAALCDATGTGTTQICVAINSVPVVGPAILSSPLGALCSANPTPTEITNLINLLQGPGGPGVVTALLNVVNALTTGNPITIAAAIQALLTSVLGTGLLIG